MTMIMGNLTGAVLIAAVAFGMGRPQSAAQELSLSDIRAQQPRETIYASDPCQRAKESTRHSIWQSSPIDPKTLVQDLNTLMDMSDDVILAGMLDRAAVVRIDLAAKTVEIESVKAGARQLGDAIRQAGYSAEAA